MQPVISTISNGVRIISIHNPNVQSAAVGAFFNVGSFDEDANTSGISHFLEHLAFKGTDTRSCMDIAQQAEVLGINMNAYTSTTVTSYYMNGLSSHLPTMFELLGDILNNSTFPEDELEMERNVILQEYDRMLDNAQQTAGSFLSEAAYGSDSAYGRPIIGTQENIKRFTRDDLIAYETAHYTGNNTVIVVAGNLQGYDYQKLTEQYFGGLVPGIAKVRSNPVYLGGVKSIQLPFNQTSFFLSFPILGATHPADNVFRDSIASFVLGSGMSSPLFVEVREKRGLVYSIGSFADIESNHGSFGIYGGTSSEHMNEMFEVVAGLLKQHAEVINPIDLERAKNQLAVSITRSSERAYQLASSFVDDLFNGLPVIPVQQQIEKTLAITSDQVKDCFIEVLSHKPSICSVGPDVSDAYLDTFQKHIR